MSKAVHVIKGVLFAAALSGMLYAGGCGILGTVLSILGAVAT